MKLSLAALAALTLCLIANAQTLAVVQSVTVTTCDGSRCTVSRYEWKARSDVSREHFLYRNGVHVGNWHYDQCQFFPFHGTKFGPGEDKAPIDPPGVPCEPPTPRSFEQSPPTANPNYGLDLDKLPSAQQFTRRGIALTREQAFEALKTVPNDAHLLRVTWIGDRNTADQIRADLAQLGQSEAVCFQTYESAEGPMLRGLGFAAAGLHVQSPDGVPLWFCHAVAGATGRRPANRRGPAPRPEMGSAQVAGSRQAGAGPGSTTVAAGSDSGSRATHPVGRGVARHRLFDQVSGRPPLAALVAPARATPAAQDAGADACTARRRVELEAELG